MSQKDVLDGWTEKDLQDSVRSMALGHGWLYYHPWRSTNSAKGWVDTVMVRDNILILAELKSMKGTVTKPQRLWLAALENVDTVVTRLWRPIDYNDEILPMLEAPRGAR